MLLYYPQDPLFIIDSVIQYILGSSGNTILFLGSASAKLSMRMAIALVLELVSFFKQAPTCLPTCLLVRRWELSRQARTFP